MRLFRTIAALRCYLDSHRSLGEVGLVPTMGALHTGHLSLIQRAREENAFVVVSIFVNPIQFGPNEDFQKYPRTLERDSQLCSTAGVDVIFAPTAEEMLMVNQRQTWRQYPYDLTPGSKSTVNHQRPTDYTQVIPPESMTSGLCGPSRPGHFQGVATIVMKLLNIVRPQRAYFGQKDAQQLAIIRRIVADLNMPVEIIPCPIVREQSGLALSSRNQYLTEEEKKHSTILWRSLQQASEMFRQGDRRAKSLIERVEKEFSQIPDTPDQPPIHLEYVDIVDPTTMQPLEKIESVGLMAIAVRIGQTRLIDNIMLRHRSPIIAIDGPAGAGKSTVARQVAQKLGLLYLDTGAMYRAVTWLVLQQGINPEDEAGVVEVAASAEIQFTEKATGPSQIWINGTEVTQAIRTQLVTLNVSAIAAISAVRQLLVKQQQRYADLGGVVAEGRDIGTYVFPDAELKIFLTASVQERANRRQKDLKHQGQEIISLDQLEQEIGERDRQDSTRAMAPLRKAKDAIEITTDGLAIEDVIHQIVTLYYTNV